MTQNKNKKGIAKKALSISLVAAMLATSNVPVWASGFEAVDPAVEGFALEESVEVPAAEIAETEDILSESINEKNFNGSAIKVTENVAWGTPVTVTGNLLDSSNANVLCEAVWLTNGSQAAGSGAVQGNISASDATYTPVYDDYGKELTLRLTVKEGENIVYQNEFSAGTVEAKDISKEIIAPSFKDIDKSYTGNELKLQPKNYSADKLFYNDADGLNLTYTDFDINYSQEDQDYTNVTGKDIVVTYSVNEEKAPGYTGIGAVGTYKIAAKAAESDDFVVSLKNKSFEYTGAAINFSKDEVVLTEKATGKDVSAALKDGVLYTGGTLVGENYTVSIDPSDIDTTVEATKSVFANYNLTTYTSTETYSIVPRDLSAGTARLAKSYEASKFNTSTIQASDIILTGKDGKEVTLGSLTDLTINYTEAATAAIKKGEAATIPGGVILTAETDSNNYSKSVTMDLVLVSRAFADMNVYINNGNTILDNAKPTINNANVKLPYIAKAYDLKKDYGLVVKDTTNTLKSDEYTVSYEKDTINAGVVKVTITGQGSYAGNSKVVYFAITPAEITSTDVSKTTDNALTIDYENDGDASLYKDAFGLKIEKTLDGKKVVLKEGTDYTVKYFYTKTAVTDNVADVNVTANGENAVGNYVTAKITLTKDGNYTDKGIKYVSLNLVEKSIKDVTIIINPESYTYTGKEITPTIIVKDGSKYLYAGEDYTLKLKNNIEVGTATATIVAKAGSGYKVGTEASKDFTITAANAADVEVTLNPTTNSYTGRQIKPAITKVTLNGVDVTSQFSITSDRVVYGENINAGKDMGSVTISPKTGNKNFTGTKTATFDIKGKALTGTLKVYDKDGKEITATPEYRYTGNEIKFAKAVFIPDNKTLDLTEGTDYEIVYIDNVYPGNSNVAVIAKGNYENPSTLTAADGTVIKNVVASKTFTITGATFTAKDITIANGVYAGGIAVKPVVTVKVNDYTLTEGKDYELKVSTAAGATISGTPYVDATVDTPYKVQIIGKGAWADSNVADTFAWGIDKRNLKDCDVTVVNGATTVKIGEITVPASNYTVTDNGDGSYTVAATANNKNLTGSVTVLESATQAPASTTLRVTDRTTSTVSLAWDKVSGAEGYTIWFRSEYDTKVSRKIIQGGDVISWTQNGLQPGTKYFYTIRAWVKDDTGYVFGEQSPVQRGTTKPIAAVVKSASATNGYIKVVLAGKAAGAKMYSMCYSKSANFNDFAVGIRTSYTTRSFTKAVKAGTYYVRVKSYRDLGNNKRVYGAWSNAVKVVVK